MKNLYFTLRKFQQFSGSGKQFKKKKEIESSTTTPLFATPRYFFFFLNC